MNTPTVYSGMRALTLPLNATSNAIATAARTTMPVLNASRSPRNWNWRGRKPSRARMLDRRGKSANDVFAARISSSAVAIWTSQRYGDPSPTIVLATWLTTVTCSDGSGRMPIWPARKLMPRKIRANDVPIIASTSRALRASGRLKAGTPFETASVPVSATDPDEKARRIRSTPSGSAVPCGSHAVGGV